MPQSSRMIVMPWACFSQRATSAFWAAAVAERRAMESSASFFICGTGVRRLNERWSGGPSESSRARRCWNRGVPAPVCFGMRQASALTQTQAPDVARELLMQKRAELNDQLKDLAARRAELFGQRAQMS